MLGKNQYLKTMLLSYIYLQNINRGFNIHHGSSVVRAHSEARKTLGDKKRYVINK